MKPEFRARSVKIVIYLFKKTGSVGFLKIIHEAITDYTGLAVIHKSTTSLSLSTRNTKALLVHFINYVNKYLFYLYYRLFGAVIRFSAGASQRIMSGVEQAFLSLKLFFFPSLWGIWHVNKRTGGWMQRGKGIMSFLQYAEVCMFISLSLSDCTYSHSSSSNFTMTNTNDSLVILCL